MEATVEANVEANVEAKSELIGHTVRLGSINQYQPSGTKCGSAKTSNFLQCSCRLMASIMALGPRNPDSIPDGRVMTCMWRVSWRF